MSESLSALATAAEARAEEASAARSPPTPAPTPAPAPVVAPPLMRTTSGGAGIIPAPLVRQASTRVDAAWFRHTSIEERSTVRSKIREAYATKCHSMEELLETCAALQEELLFLSAPTRLDYFKQGLHWDQRVVEKRKQLEGQCYAPSALSASEEKAPGAGERPAKRGKEA
mmetsp:Transcript_9731/g.33088  ORF Transcript_9731/g.33088 Transcript_9731/m.33088 type:complete len:171 (-) Transcript_9731:27-539(-)